MPNLYIDPDWMYVSTLLNDLKWELQGFHTKIAEIEALRYYEAPVQLPANEVRTGQKVRVGLTAELMENIKAAILAQAPMVSFKPLRKGDAAVANAELREHIWQGELDKMMGKDGNTPNYIGELADGQMLGLGIYKVSEGIQRWDPKVRRRRAKESVNDHVERVNAYKEKQGMPISDVVVHPIAIYSRPGEGSKVEEVIEYSYKARNTVYGQYNMHGPGFLQYSSFKQMPGWKSIAAMPGQPTDFVRPLPSGIDTTNYVLVTEYWNPGVYKVFVNGTEVYKEYEPTVKYFIAPGRTSSSKDPDKFAISVAESLRHNEPQIDRLLTRMLEAAELIVNKRLTLEVPESYTPEFEEIDGVQIPKEFTFTDDHADALPAGARVIDPFEGANQVYQAMPLAQLLMQIAGQHGISPLFKGVSPGAAGSGYRDNSLYLMAKSLIQYVIGSLEGCLTAIISHKEDLVAYSIKQEVWVEGRSLKPNDIINYPATIQVRLQPSLPQNQIAEGGFWEQQRQAGNVSRRYVREKGLNLEQPNEMDREIDLEQAKEQLKPLLRQRVLMRVIGMPDPNADPNAAAGAGAEPGADELSRINAGAGVPTAGMGQNGAGREQAGRATGGQPKAPTQEPAGFPPPNNENR